MGDAMQNLLELAYFRPELRPFLQTIRKVEGYSVLCIEGRDTLDAATMARVFMAYVADNCEQRKTRVISIGFTQKWQAKLHVLVHAALSEFLSFDTALLAMLYDLPGLFRYKDFTPGDKLRMPKLQFGCSYQDLFDTRDKHPNGISSISVCRRSTST